MNCQHPISQGVIGAMYCVQCGEEVPAPPGRIGGAPYESAYTQQDSVSSAYSGGLADPDAYEITLRLASDFSQCDVLVPEDLYDVLATYPPGTRILMDDNPHFGVQLIIKQKRGS